MIKKFFSKKTASKTEKKHSGVLPEPLPANAFQMAMQCHQNGDFVQADALYRKILQLEPNHPDALHYLGVLAYQMGQADVSVDLISQAIHLNPTSSQMHCNLGLAFQGLGKLDAAIDSYRKALEVQPDYATAHHDIGNALQTQGKQDEAIDSYRNALSVQPDYVDAYYNLGNALLAQGKIEAALEMYRYVLFFKPDAATEVKNNLTRLLKQHGKTNQAIENYQAQLVLSSGNAIDYYKFGIACYEQGKWEVAVKCFRGAIALKPDYADAYYNLGGLLQAQGELDEAIENYQKTLSLQPNHVEANEMWFYAQLSHCDWSTYESHCEKITQAVKSGTEGYNPFRFLATSSSVVEQSQCAKGFAKQYPLSGTPLWTGQRYQHNKIRIAYVSGDFREHALSFLMAGLFELHDSQRFDVIAISLSPEDNSILGKRVKSAFSQFVDVSSLGDHEIALLMRELEIEIAVDLMGFTGECRAGIFAHRPAPIQVNYLGYPATMGVDYIDYIFADSYLVPPKYQQYYTEKTVYLPDCFQANDGKRVIGEKKPIRSKVNLPESGFVFCSFNNSYKINPIFFEVWMRLLKTVPDSVLWLVADNPTVANNLRHEAIERGVNPERLIFAARIAYPDYLARFQLADLFLDTLPFNAGTTASDALWAGVPVLTCSGEAFAARMAGSLLIAVGLPELITHSLEEYEALAFKLATTPEILADIRARLARNRDTHPLFDTDRFRRHIESAYITMWERYQHGELPVSFAVQAID